MSNTSKFKGWRLSIGLVVVPMVLAVTYYSVLAVDRYVSSSQVVVRQEGNNASAALPGLGALLTGTNPASREQTLYLREYITSNDMMQVLEDRLHWVEHFQQQRRDMFFWLAKDAKREDLLKFYQRMVTAHYDETAGLMTVEVQALTPQMSKDMLNVILSSSENFVNEVSHGMARDQMAFAAGELNTAREKYEHQKKMLLSFQNDNKVLDGRTSAESRADIIATLEGEYSRQQAIATQMQYKLRADAPQVEQQKQKINALRVQLTAEKRLLVSAPGGVQANVVASNYRQLTLDAEIAEDTYKASVAALDNARMEASKKISTLVTVVSPNTPEKALYPETLYNLITIFLGLLMLYGITRFIIASIEDHRD